ncbi:hypothetical protein DPX16_13215 [Anabarilius grahami]|uniref:Uncharacterized protein n=1 Tax=Anabarilius grahami TaxID=495550 RepID=A0A3N0YNI4_ANAGA|nr:hypothetical protein DPX16_13215 [Anabarilius grahami]
MDGSPCNIKSAVSGNASGATPFIAPAPCTTRPLALLSRMPLIKTQPEEHAFVKVQGGTFNFGSPRAKKCCKQSAHQCVEAGSPLLLWNQRVIAVSTPHGALLIA